MAQNMTKVFATCEVRARLQQWNSHFSLSTPTQAPTCGGVYSLNFPTAYSCDCPYKFTIDARPDPLACYFEEIPHTARVTPALTLTVPYHCKLFVEAKNVNPFGIKQIHTLAATGLLHSPETRVRSLDFRISAFDFRVSICSPFVFITLHATPFVSHPYKTPGVSPQTHRCKASAHE
jgi:hypothetical protein